jgi:hypothetical protein
MTTRNKRLTKILSCLGITIGIWLTLENVAKADHSLADVMSDSATIAEAVNQIQDFNNVVCDTENSSQSYYYPSEAGETGTAWKQIALCFQDENALMQARDYFINGGSLGFYGTPGLVGVLIVSYTWENFQAGSLISIDYK